MIQQWYPFLWALVGVLASLVVVLLCFVCDEDKAHISHKKWKLRDNCFFAVFQNPQRGAA